MRCYFELGMPIGIIEDAFRAVKVGKDFLWIDLVGTPFSTDYVRRAHNDMLCVPLRPDTQPLLVSLTQEASGSYTLRSHTSSVFELFARGETLTDVFRNLVVQCEKWMRSPPELLQ